MYRIIEIQNLDGSISDGLIREIDGEVAQIPMVEGNSDYQAYLASLEPVVDAPVDAPVEELVAEDPAAETPAV